MRISTILYSFAAIAIAAMFVPSSSMAMPLDGWNKEVTYSVLVEIDRDQASFKDMQLETVAILNGLSKSPPLRSTAWPGLLKPIYALSLSTDGKSLARYHMRC